MLIDVIGRIAKAATTDEQPESVYVYAEYGTFRMDFETVESVEQLESALDDVKEELDS